MYSPSDDLSNLEVCPAGIIPFLEAIRGASRQEQLIIKQFLENLESQDKTESELDIDENPYTTRPCSTPTFLSALQHLNPDDYHRLLDRLIEAPQFKALSLSAQRSLVAKLANQVSGENLRLVSIPIELLESARRLSEKKA